MSKFELVILVVLSVFNVSMLVFGPLYYAIKWEQTYLDTCKEIYGFMFKDIKKDFKAFIAMSKKVAKVLYDGVCAFIDLFKTPPDKIFFDDAFEYAMRRVLAEYVFAPFIPDIVYFYNLPSRVIISLYTKSIISPETTQEIVWHVQAVFQRYLDSLGIHIEYVVVPYVIDNKIDICILYCEHANEYLLYKNACRQATYMNVERTCAPLPEQLVVKTNGVVLGYDFSKWESSGQVVPIMWDMAKAPHMQVSGITSGGKSIYTKQILERLLELGAIVSIADFKGFGDYKSYKGNYAICDKCDDLLRQFCQDFENAKANGGNADGRYRVLIFDEWGSYAAGKSKKEFDELMSMISSVIQMGRAYKYSVILISQRFDATDTLKGNLREQFGIKVYMGSTISTQSASMLFPNSEIKKSERLQEYCGYISTPTTDLEVIITPKVDVEALDRRIEKLSSKN